MSRLRRYVSQLLLMLGIPVRFIAVADAQQTEPSKATVEQLQSEIDEPRVEIRELKSHAQVSSAPVERLTGYPRRPPVEEVHPSPATSTPPGGNTGATRIVLDRDGYPIYGEASNGQLRQLLGRVLKDKGELYV
jgi:hypothetical protein